MMPIGERYANPRFHSPTDFRSRSPLQRTGISNSLLRIDTGHRALKPLTFDEIAPIFGEPKDLDTRSNLAADQRLNRLFEVFST